MSHDAVLDPNNFISSPFDFDEPDTPTPDPEPPPLHVDQDTNFGDAHTPPVARTIQI